jgi:hypothetical protein
LAYILGLFVIFKNILAVNNPVIVGVQTLVCAYAKLKLAYSITKKLTARKYFKMPSEF